MEFQDFFKVRKRMCDKVNYCEGCPLYEYRSSCSEYLVTDPMKAERIVEKWAKENPIITNQEKFFEIFGFKLFSFKPIDIPTDVDNVIRWLKEEYIPPQREDE